VSEWYSAVDLPAVRAAVRPVHWFPPGVVRWRGNATGSWWAMVPGVGRLVEAPTEGALVGEVRRILGWAAG
jgi:hypothetical protein